MAFRNKYHVSSPADRTWFYRTYASKAEMIRARELELLRQQGVVRVVREQPVFKLGEDFTYRPDFVVQDAAPLNVEWAEDVKGHETIRFKVVRRLWAKYGPMPLRILKRTGSTWRVETIAGGADSDHG